VLIRPKKQEITRIYKKTSQYLARTQIIMPVFGIFFVNFRATMKKVKGLNAIFFGTLDDRGSRFNFTKKNTPST